MHKYGHLGKPHDKHGGDGLEEVYCENSEMSSSSLCYKHGKTHTYTFCYSYSERRHTFYLLTVLIAAIKLC
jgi:hypothetical protein